MFGNFPDLGNNSLLPGPMFFFQEEKIKYGICKVNLFAAASTTTKFFSRLVLSKTKQRKIHEIYVKMCKMGRAKRVWYLSPMRAAKVQASLRIRAVSPEPSLLAHKSSESRGTFREKARSLAPLNGWACAVKICHDGMLEDTNSLDGAQMVVLSEVWLI